MTSANSHFLKDTIALLEYIVGIFFSNLVNGISGSGEEQRVVGINCVPRYRSKGLYALLELIVPRIHPSKTRGGSFNSRDHCFQIQVVLGWGGIRWLDKASVTIFRSNRQFHSDSGGLIYPHHSCIGDGLPCWREGKLTAFCSIPIGNFPI